MYSEVLSYWKRLDTFRVPEKWRLNYSYFDIIAYVSLFYILYSFKYDVESWYRNSNPKHNALYCFWYFLVAWTKLITKQVNLEPNVNH